MDASDLSSAVADARTVLSVDRVAKCYRIYEQPHHRLLQAIFRRKQYFRDFWAVNDVSLNVRRGETVGILGRNGSGKSTLLQIVAGILQPTQGRVTTHGRIAALLELGAGFNPEFSGRDNAILNASILGVPEVQVASRLPQIIEFSALGDFIDQPVKTYSSGMFARLAFAVAINVDPEILIIDEALSVGDSGFQLKCLLKMRALQELGVTIIFCSHDTSSVIRLCDRALVLEKGTIVANDSNVLECCKLYDRLSRNASFTGAKPSLTIEPKDRDYEAELGGIEETRFGSGEARYLDVTFLSEEGEERATFTSGEPIEIRAAILARRGFADVVNGFTLKNKDGVDVWGDNNVYANAQISLAPGLHRLSYRFELNLLPGEYFLYIGLADVSSGTRVELDQRWPVRKLTVLGSRSQLGFVYAPATVDCTPISS
ncbi:MAG: ABC transporter ATP-binding protein [Betaproteobacteria bacterium]|jgi:ABC-type polysaccharide/polyol phosphate transport system ATPase subunit